MHIDPQNHCRIPGFASYGGLLLPNDFDIPNNGIYLEKLKEGLISLLSKFRDSQVTLFPEGIYSDLFEFNLNLFLSIGFKVLWNETNFHFDLDNWNPINMSQGNLKRLRKNERNSINFNIEDSSSLDKVYDLLVKNRNHRNSFLSKTLGELQDMKSKLPQRYSLFSVKNTEEMMASALTINVTEKNAYVLYWGDNIKYRDFSPTVYLAVNLISYYRSLNYRYLDLSVCVNMTRGEDDEGLLTFKANLGALPSRKLTLHRVKKS
jgi:hypothetical protein